MLENALDYEGLKYYDGKSKEYIEEKVTDAQTGLQTELQTQIDKKAPIASPTLTGTPKAPTANAGTNTTQIATTAFVQTEIGNLINGAPETANTLKELSDLIEEHQDVTDALNEAIGKKANASDLTSHTGNTTAHITATERTNWNNASTNSHTHSNKAVLDATTASYTTALNTKLSGIATGAEVNQNAFSNVVVGSTTIAADSKTDSLTIAAGSNVTITPDATNDKITIAATDTTYSAATQSVAGLMSAADKKKLDGVATSANAYTHPTTSGNKHIPSGGSSGQILRWSADGTAVWGADNNTTYNAATTSTAGLMSAADKTKLDGIATGANAITVDSALSSTSTNPVQNKVINTALAGKANSSHGNHVPAVQTASNAIFLRNDNTWATVTPANIGAAASSHGTHVSYGTSASALGTSSAGTATTVSRSDHVHALPALTSCTGTLTVAKGGTGATTLTSGQALIGNGTNAVTTRAINTLSAVGNIGYGSSNANNLATLSTLAFWNGQYTSNKSNLAYCNQGAFGTAATYAATTSITNGGTGLITSGAVYTGLSGKAPTAHATTALTYGGGTASNYGHVKLSDSYTTSAGAAAASVAASSKALADAYTEINSNLGKVKIVKTVVTATTGATGNINLGTDKEVIRVSIPGYVALLFFSATTSTWFVKVLTDSLTIASNVSVTYTMTTIDIIG